MFERSPGELVAARELLDTAPDAMVVVGADALIVYVNRQAEILFGYPRAELLGQSLELLIPKRFHVDHRTHVARFFAAPTVRSMGSGIELFGARKDGSELPIEVSLSPLEGIGGTFVSAAIRDVSERKRIQAALRLSADRLSSAVESIPDGLAFFDADDRLFLCNSAYRMMFSEAIVGPVAGLRYPSVLDAAMTTLAFEDDAARAQFRAQRLAQRRDPGSPFECRMLDGRCLRITNRRTAEGGMVETVADITDDIEREEELRRARIEAEAGSAAKSEFLASMSHELRTPLNAILGFAQLSRRDKKEPLSERHQKRLEQILKGGEHLLRLIDDILDLARIEAGGTTLSTEPVDARALVEEVRVTLEPTATRAGLVVEVVQSASGTPWVNADRTRLAQILMNYGSNAIKYNKKSGTVIFEIARVDSGAVRFVVRDTGCGVPADKRHTLFLPFQRAGQETGSIEGTGIGLAISKKLAGLMGGTVGYRPMPPEGSEFWVELPVHADRAAADLSVLPGESSSARPVTAARGRILYVEDNPANVAFMADLLGAFEDIELVVAPTAEIGLELARSTLPAIVVMDINLPGMSGFDALRALRALPDTARIPVIALTAAASERDRQRGEQAGFHRYLTKPVQVAELEAVLEALLTPH